MLFHMLPALESKVLECASSGSEAAVAAAAEGISTMYLGAVNDFIAKDIALAAQAAGTYESVKSQSSASEQQPIPAVRSSSVSLNLNAVPMNLSSIPELKARSGHRRSQHEQRRATASVESICGGLVGKQLFYNEVSQLQQQLKHVVESK